jgi:hypothetical protein
MRALEAVLAVEWLCVARVIGCAPDAMRDADAVKDPGADAGSDADADADARVDDGTEVDADAGAGGDGDGDPDGDRWPAAEHGQAVELPTCGQDDPEVLHISEVQDWGAINDPALRVFCVHPGDYTQKGAIELTADGTPGRERWIRWYDPASPDDDTSHPATMQEEQRAVIERLLLGAEGDAADFLEEALDGSRADLRAAREPLGREPARRFLRP